MSKIFNGEQECMFETNKSLTQSPDVPIVLTPKVFVKSSYVKPD